jgi:hypothetical protein
MKKIFNLVFLMLIGFSVFLSAQDKIEDNSFLIEEAYNQEKGVIQYINTFRRDRGGVWGYTFTNEIPIKTQKHQFSYTIPIGNSGLGTGLGDIAINYRYQAYISEKYAVSPRVSLLVPTGNKKRGLTTNGVGVQVNLPVSVSVSNKVVTHSNIGGTFTPNAKNILGQKAAANDFFAGQSIIYLAKPTFNIMFESLYENKTEIIGNNLTARRNVVTLNPGIRWAHNLKSGWQIVPGVAVPFGVGPSWGERGAFLYLSFEK